MSTKQECLLESGLKDTLLRLFTDTDIEKELKFSKPEHDDLYESVGIILKSMFEAFRDDVASSIDDFDPSRVSAEALKQHIGAKQMNLLNSARILHREANVFAKLLDRAKDRVGFSEVIRDYYDNIRVARERYHWGLYNKIDDSFDEVYGRNATPKELEEAKRLWSDHLMGSSDLKKKLVENIGDDWERKAFDALLDGHFEKYPVLNALTKAYKKIDEFVLGMISQEGMPFTQRQNYVFKFAPYREIIMANPKAYEDFLYHNVDFDMIFDGKQDVTDEMKLQWANERTIADMAAGTDHRRMSNRIDVSRELVFKNRDAEYQFFKQYMNPDMDILTSAFAHKMDLIDKVVSYRFTGADPLGHRQVIKDMVISKNSTLPLVKGMKKLKNAGPFEVSRDVDMVVNRFSRAAGVGEYGSAGDVTSNVSMFVDRVRNFLGAGLTPFTAPRDWILDSASVPAIQKRMVTQKGSILYDTATNIWKNVGGSLQPSGKKIKDQVEFIRKHVALPIEVSLLSQMRGEASAANMLDKASIKSDNAWREQRWAEKSFKWNGAKRAVDYARSARALEAGAIVEEALSVGWDNLSPLSRSYVEELDISKADFEAMRAAERFDYEGTTVFRGSFDDIDESLIKTRGAKETLEQARARIKNAYDGWVHNILDYMATTNRSRGEIMEAGDARSPIVGLITQFTRMPLSAIRGITDNMERLYGVKKGRGAIFESLGRSVKGDPAAFAEALVALYAGGLMIGWMKDLTAGKTPRDIDNLETHVKAFTETGLGGLATIIGNQIWHKGDIAGTTLSSPIGTLAKLGRGLARGDADASARAASRFLESSPVTNLFYAKWLKNYLFYNALDVERSPNELRRDRERGTESFVD